MVGPSPGADPLFVSTVHTKRPDVMGSMSDRNLGYR